MATPTVDEMLRIDAVVRDAFRRFHPGTIEQGARCALRSHTPPRTQVRIAAHAILGSGPAWDRMRRAAAALQARGT